MRDLNECKAEVFRRSEQRIKERKKRRNRIAAVCIPLCLVVAALLAADLPGRKMSEDKNTVMENAMGSVMEFSAVEIQGNFAQQYRKVTAVDEIAELHGTILAYYHTDGNAAEDSADTGPTTEDYHVGNSLSQKPECSIRFTAENGTEQAFTLQGNALYDETGGRTAYLTAEQLTELKTLLGLTD